MLGDRNGKTYISALTHSFDSQWVGNVRFCLDGTDSLRNRERVGSGWVGGDRLGSQPTAKACGARAGGACVCGGRSGAARGGAAWRQPPDGLALATTLRGSGGGGSVARQDAQAREAADRGRDGGARGGIDLCRSTAR